MSQEVDEEIVAVEEKLSNLDVLVCGLCHIGFHFLEEFQEHKVGGTCKKISLIQNHNSMDTQPKIHGFFLWKNSQAKQIAENQKIWKVYQLWYVLPDSVKNCWIEAGKTLSTYNELAKTIPNKTIKLDLNSQNGSLDDLPSGIMKRIGEFPAGQEFVFERVIARRFNQEMRQFEYLLKWKGYPPELNTWEPAKNMSACAHIIKQYEESLVKNGGASSTGKRPRPRRPRKTKQIQNMRVVSKPKVSSQAQIGNFGLGKQSVRSIKQKTLDKVKYWYGTMKANEEVTENKQTQQNILKRDYVMKEEEENNEDTPALKKIFFHAESEDKDWDNPGILKSNASTSENEEPPNTSLGKIIPREQLTMEECIKYNISRIITSPSILFPTLKREEYIKKMKAHLKNIDMGYLQVSPKTTKITLASMKGSVKLKTNHVPKSGIYLFSSNNGLTRLDDGDKTQILMMMMMKNRDEPKKGKVVYTDGAQALKPPIKNLELNKARKAIYQSSPLMKSYAKKPFLHKVAAANPEFEKSLLQKQQNSPRMKTHNKNITFVPRLTTIYTRVQQDVSIPPYSPTLCPTTGKRLTKAEGEKTPEPTPPSSPKSMITIDETTMMSRQNDNSNVPTITKLVPGSGGLVTQSPVMSINEPKKVNMNRTTQMHHQARQTYVNNKGIPVASNSGVKKLEPHINQQCSEQKAILTDEFGRLILSADDEHSMITIKGDDGMLYQVSAAQLAAGEDTVLLAGNGETDGQQSVFLIEDDNGMIQTNTNQEGMISLDDISNSVCQLTPEKLDLGNLVTDDAGNMFMKDNETGHYVLVSATEQGGQVVKQASENYEQEPQVMQEEQDEVLAQIIDVIEPALEGGLRRVVLQLPDGNLLVTEMDEEQFAALEKDN